MKVVVGSTNPPKLSAVTTAFHKAFPNEDIEIQGVTTDSKVRSHPITADEALLGARNRIKHTKQQINDANYYVGIEGGLVRVSEQAFELGWIIIEDANGTQGTGLSSGFELRGAMLSAILNGTELNDVLENDYGIASSGVKNGFSGLVSNDIVTRETAYEQGVVFALGQLLHPEFYRP